jgi:glycosyltransferase involved in cell wall biosynthesis
MDADLQHQPEDIPRFIEEYTRTKYDVIIGSRLHDKKGMPIHRILSNTITTGLVRLRTGANISDSQSGFRFITRTILEQIRLQSTGFEAETEFLIKATALGISFGSIPIETIYAGEKSNMTHLQTTINFIKVLFKRY